jgi:hypothetical protein
MPFPLCHQESRVRCDEEADSKNSELQILLFRCYDADTGGYIPLQRNPPASRTGVRQGSESRASRRNNALKKIQGDSTISHFMTTW